MGLRRSGDDTVAPVVQAEAEVVTPEPETAPESAPEAAPVAESAKGGGLKVIAPLVSVRFGDKVLQYSFGDVLPAGVAEASVKLLTELGFVEPV